MPSNKHTKLGRKYGSKMHPGGSFSDPYNVGEDIAEQLESLAIDDEGGMVNDKETFAPSPNEREPSFNDMETGDWKEAKRLAKKILTNPSIPKQIRKKITDNTTGGMAGGTAATNQMHQGVRNFKKRDVPLYFQGNDIGLDTITFIEMKWRKGFKIKRILEVLNARRKVEKRRLLMLQDIYSVLKVSMAQNRIVNRRRMEGEMRVSDFEVFYKTWCSGATEAQCTAAVYPYKNKVFIRSVYHNLMNRLREVRSKAKLAQAKHDVLIHEDSINRSFLKYAARKEVEGVGCIVIPISKIPTHLLDALKTMPRLLEEIPDDGPIVLRTPKQLQESYEPMLSEKKLMAMHVLENAGDQPIDQLIDPADIPKPEELLPPKELDLSKGYDPESIDALENPMDFLNMDDDTEEQLDYVEMERRRLEKLEAAMRSEEPPEEPFDTSPDPFDNESF